MLFEKSSANSVRKKLSKNDFVKNIVEFINLIEESLLESEKLILPSKLKYFFRNFSVLMVKSI